MVQSAAKLCASCGTEKSAMEFLPTSFAPDGFTNTCKACTFAHSERDRRERDARRCEADARKQARKPSLATAPETKSKRASS